MLTIILKKPGPYIRNISVWKPHCGRHSPVHKLWRIWALIRLHASFGKYVGLDFLTAAGYSQNRGWIIHLSFKSFYKREREPYDKRNVRLLGTWLWCQGAEINDRKTDLVKRCRRYDSCDHLTLFSLLTRGGGVEGGRKCTHWSQVFEAFLGSKRKLLNVLTWQPNYLAF